MIEKILVLLLMLAVTAAALQTHRLSETKLALVTLQRDHAQQIADDNARAVSAWRDEWTRQQAADSAQRAVDEQQDQATAAALRDIAARYAGLAQRLAPPGTCRLSAEWVKQFNEVR